MEDFWCLSFESWLNKNWRNKCEKNLSYTWGANGKWPLGYSPHFVVSGNFYNKSKDLDVIRVTHTCNPSISFQRVRKEDLSFKVRLGYIGKHCLKKRKKIFFKYFKFCLSTSTCMWYIHMCAHICAGIYVGQRSTLGIFLYCCLLFLVYSVFVYACGYLGTHAHADARERHWVPSSSSGFFQNGSLAH